MRAAAASSDIPTVLGIWAASEAEPTVTDNESSLRLLLRRDPGALLVVELEDAAMTHQPDRYKGVRMAEAASVQMLRKGYKAFAAQDMEALAEVIPEDAVWHVPGRGPLAGDYKGRDAIFGYFAKLMEVSGHLKPDLVHIVGDDKFAIALQRSTWTVQGRSYNGTDVLVDRVDASGLAVETWEYLEDQALADEMLASG